MHLQATKTTQNVPLPFNEESLRVPEGFTQQLQKIRMDKTLQMQGSHHISRSGNGDTKQENG
jgi:hypothetical protein